MQSNSSIELGISEEDEVSDLEKFDDDFIYDNDELLSDINSKTGYCSECGKPRSHYRWCQSCETRHFREDFDKWTSENEKIDNFLKKSQLSATSPKGVFEWIPYN